MQSWNAGNLDAMRCFLLHHSLGVQTDWSRFSSALAANGSYLAAAAKSHTCGTGTTLLVRSLLSEWIIELYVQQHQACHVAATAATVAQLVQSLFRTIHPSLVCFLHTVCNHVGHGTRPLQLKKMWHC